MSSPVPPGNQNYRDIIQIINTFYERFLHIVTEARASKGLTKERLIDLGATVYMSEDAQKLGYIDKANVRYEEAMNFLMEEAKCGKHVQVINYYNKSSFLESLQSRIQKKLDAFFGEDDMAPCRYEMR